MVRRRNESKDKGLRLIVGVILLLIGLSGFGVMPMMGWEMLGYGFGLYGSLISVALVVLGAYLIYDGLKED